MKENFCRMILCLGILGILVIVVTLVIKYRQRSPESFDIPVRSSSAWDWNTGPGYGAGYGTGYGLYGVFPATIPNEPWRYWMWRRRPLIFFSPYTPVPQIDYNHAAPPGDWETTNFRVSILPHKGRYVPAVNGMPLKTLILVRNRPYYFHIYTPGLRFAIGDGTRALALFQPIESGNLELNFDNSQPDILFYYLVDNNGQTVQPAGVIYLQNTRWN